MSLDFKNELEKLRFSSYSLNNKNQSIENKRKWTREIVD